MEPVLAHDVCICLVTVLILVPFSAVVADVDIRGANEFGWYSVLVRTGNFKGEGNSVEFPARRVFDDVEQAVDWIVGHEDRRLLNLMKAKEQGIAIVDEDEGYYTD